VEQSLQRSGEDGGARRVHQTSSEGLPKRENRGLIGEREEGIDENAYKNKKSEARISAETGRKKVEKRGLSPANRCKAPVGGIQRKQQQRKRETRNQKPRGRQEKRGRGKTMA